MVDSLTIVVAQAIVQYLRGSKTAAAEWAVGERREIDRYAEPIGSDVRLVDNSGSEVDLGRTLTISNSVERQFKVDVEATRTSGSSSGVSLAALSVRGELSAHIEQVVRTGISGMALQKHSVEEKLEFKVPARTVLTITLTWKRIWQRGEMTLRSNRGENLVVPYQESVAMDFDLGAITTP